LIAEFDGKPSIIDFKTSSRRKSADEIEGYFLQATGYSLMYEERTGEKIDQLVILMVVEGSNDSIIFVEQRDNWVDLLRERRDEYFDYLNKKINS
jgi:genome maintenance exonuclease 1